MVLNGQVIYVCISGSILFKILCRFLVKAHAIALRIALDHL